MKKGRISIFIWCKGELPYDHKLFEQMVNSIWESDYGEFELLLVDESGKGEDWDFLQGLKKRQRKRVKLIAEKVKSRAQAINRALKEASGEVFLVLLGDANPIFLKKSALRTIALAMARDPKVGMLYADYNLRDAQGGRKERRLLNFQPGRFRDETDFGHACAFRTRVLEKLGGACEEYEFGEMYDLRLKVSERYNVVLIGNKWEGALYEVQAGEKGHDVFSYLKAGKEFQIEMEKILTEHLKRIDAYLPPGFNYHKVEYSAEEEAQFKECIASVVVPVNRRPEFIGYAIKSVQRQTVQNIEIIVMVNGGDGDPTAEVVKKYMKGGDLYDPTAPAVRLMVLDINNIGLCLDTGISMARGKYYVQLDSDDRLKPNAVELIVKEFDKDPRAGMVIGSYEVWEMEADGERVFRREDIPVVTHDEWTEENGRNNLLRVNGAGAPRAAHIKVIKELGWFGVNDTPYSRNYGEDYDLVLRLSEQYRVARIWEPIYEVIRHTGGTDHSIDQVTIDRNDEAKDHMRLEAVRRRQKLMKASRRGKS